MSFAGWLVAVQVVAATPLSLDEVRVASRRQLDAVRAELDLTRAQAATKQARSAIFPQLDFSLSASDTFAGPQRTFSTVPTVDDQGNVAYVQRAVDTPSFTQGRFSLGLTLSQLIYDGGRWWNQISRAGAQEEAARGQLAEQQLASELEATRRFYEVVKAKLALQVLNEAVQRSNQQLERAQGMYEAGRGQRGAVYDATTNLGNDRISVIRQAQAANTARLVLLQWLGRPDDEDVEIVVPDLETLPSVPAYEDSLARAKTQRPLVKSIEQQLRAQELAVDVARADYFPRLSASASYFRSSPTADPFFTDPTKQNAVTIGATLNWNLFSGFQHESAVERARADVSTAQAQQRQMLVDLQSELKRTTGALAAELEVLKLAESNLKTAEAQAKLEEERFSAGAATSLEVRNAQTKLTQAKITMLQSRADVAIARAALDRAVGFPEKTP